MAGINNTLTKIQTITVGSGGASSIDFTSIPQTYTDLVIKISSRSDVSGGGRDYFALRFNGSSSSYSWRWMYGYDSSVVGANSATAQTYQKVFAMNDSQSTANVFGTAEIYIPNYTSANYKSSYAEAIAENNSTATYMLNMNAGLWSSTSAINQITIYPNNGGGTGNFVQYTTATLYGVSNNTTGSSALATGGTITYNGAYVYHTFLASGTFTPTKALTGVEAILVAGGGGGGGHIGGGGGAGGVLALTGLSCTTSAYSISVGSGGAGGVYATSKGTNGLDSSFGSLGTAVGGGGGGTRDVASAGNSGGSGGGGTGSNYGGTGTLGQGFSGGSPLEFAGPYPGGGGGGAGGNGGNAGPDRAGFGGVGTAAHSVWGLVTSTGENVNGLRYYAGGGGGGVNTSGYTLVSGGYGGGGNANTWGNNPTAGTANTGGGGGGSNNGRNGAAGGSGVVIIRYMAQ